MVFNKAKLQVWFVQKPSQILFICCLFLIHSTTCQRMMETHCALCNWMGAQERTEEIKDRLCDCHGKGLHLCSHAHCEPRPTVPTPEGSTTPEGLCPTRAQRLMLCCGHETKDMQQQKSSHGHTLATCLHTCDKLLERSALHSQTHEEHGCHTHKMKTLLPKVSNRSLFPVCWGKN